MEPFLSGEQYALVRAIQEGVSPGEYTLTGEICTLGRHRSCQIVISKEIISRQHARIEWNGLRYFLYDANSTNGTFVNGRQIHEPHMLQNDDHIGLGNHVPMLHFLDPNATVVARERLRYDDRRMLFYLKNQELDLTPAQFQLLLCLYQRAGEVCTRESCAQSIWGRNYKPGLDADALDQAITSLRQKLRQLDPAADLIKTRRGLGFVLEL